MEIKAKLPYFDEYTREFRFTNGLVMGELQYWAYRKKLQRETEEWENAENLRRQLNAISATEIMNDMLSGAPPSIAYKNRGKVLC